MSATTKNIPIFMFNLLQRVLQEAGYSSDKLVAETELSVADLTDQSTRVSFEEATQIIRNAYYVSGDMSLGLKVARQINTSDWGLMGYAITSCSDLEEALKIGLRYSKIATKLTANTLQYEGDFVVLTSGSLYPTTVELPFIVEEDLGGVVNVLHHFYGDTIHPKVAQFSYAKPSYYQEYEEHFGCPVEFNCEQNRLVWHARDLTRPTLLPTGNPAAAQMAISQCEKLIAEQDDEASVVEQVRAIVVQKPGEFAPITTVAQQLNMSESSLRRVLKQAKTSYQIILTNVRKKMAMEYLTTSNLRLDQIAYLVGYSDLSNFRRAFKQWTGMAPLDYRRKTRVDD